MNAKKIHKERHKRWETKSPWAAEWFANTVSFCKTQEGKKRFEDWILITHGPQIFQIKMREIYAPPRRRFGLNGGNLKMWNSAAVELGVSDEFLKEAHTFASDQRLCEPERTLPAPVRRRYEASSDWFIRRTDALLMGAKIPSIQWDELRRIAFSEFDHIRDQMEAWRTQPDYSLMGLQERAKSTIITPGSAAPGEQWIQACTDAMRSRLHLAHTQYAAWSQAAALFADLDRMGATTAPAVLKILKKDNTMLGRLVAVLCAVIELGRWQQGKLPQVLTSSEYLRPYFHRTRDQTGISKVYTNNDFATRAKMPVESIECLLAHWLRLGGQKYGGAPLLAELHKRTLDPMEAAKLTAEALETIVTEFADGFQFSTFSSDLANLVEEATRTGGSKTWESQCTAILPQKLKPDESINLMKIRFPSFAQYERLYRQQSLTWLSVIWKLECRDLLRMLLETDVWRVEHYDFMWFTLDTLLWEGASRLERKPGRLGKLYELISPDAKQRPLATRHYWDEVLKSLEEQTVDERRKREEEELRASYVQEIPTATPQESIAKAPERSEEQLKPKTRKRRKGKGDQAHPDLTSAPTEAATEPQATPSNAPVRQDVPDILPKGWKLGRKTVDIFNRLLDPKEKSGQIRWADFETAMQQIGFNVVQTEGSSVRFDPPAIRARPITFHRPHPDSTLTPGLVRIVGARLKRCYGWTVGSFTLDSAEDLNLSEGAA